MAEATAARPKDEGEKEFERGLYGWIPTIAALADYFQDPAQREAFARKVVKTALISRRDPKKKQLRECTLESFGIALCQLTEAGLEPDGVEAALVPYGKIVQAQTMFQGMVKLLYGSGMVKDVDAAIVYAKELEQGRFQEVRGGKPNIIHRPLYTDRGPPVLAYAVIRLLTGGVIFDVMNEEDILKRRASSKAYAANPKESPWSTWPEEMWKKTPLRRLAKRAPKSEQLRKALAIDAADFIEAEYTREDGAPKGAAAVRSAVAQLVEPPPRETFEFGAQKEPVPVQRAQQQQKPEPAKATGKPAVTPPPPSAAAKPDEPLPPPDAEEPANNEPPGMSDSELEEFERGFSK